MREACQGSRWLVHLHDEDRGSRRGGQGPELRVFPRQAQVLYFQDPEQLTVSGDNFEI